MSDPIAHDEARLRVLEVGHRQLTDQMAEIAVELREIRMALGCGESRMGSIETDLRDARETLAEVRDILQVTRAGLKVLGGIGTAVRWIGYLAAAATALWVFASHVKNGGPRP